jgi:hypothetical protein
MSGGGPLNFTCSERGETMRKRMTVRWGSEFEFDDCCAVMGSLDDVARVLVPA